MLFFIFWKGPGLLVPVLAVLGPVVGLAVGSIVHASAGLESAFAGLGLATIGGVGVWFVARRAYERSGNVRYDAQNDRPVVTGQTSGHFYFIPTRAWAVILGVIGVAWAAVSLL